MARTSRKVITTAMAVNARPRAGQYEIHDRNVPGLMLRVGARSKTWAIRYRAPNGKHRRATLGTFPAMSVAGARTAARNLRDGIEAGADPAAPAINAGTFGALCERWFARKVQPAKKPNTVKQYRLLLDRHILPNLGDKPTDTIGRRMVIDFLEDQVAQLVAKGRRGTQANRLQACLSSILNYAVDLELITGNPIARLKKQVAERAKDRILDEAEITAVMAGDRKHDMALKLILATGQRPGEVLAMTRTDVDLKTAIWTLADNKSGRRHAVPLSPLALDLIGAALQTARGDRLFSISTSALGNSARDRDLTWTPHDLRRTCATGMAMIGTPRHVVSRVLNHADSSVTGTHYDHHSYQPEMTTALNAWAAHLDQIAGIDRGAATPLHAR